MHEAIIFAGFGGQGVLFAGQLLSYAAMREDKHVTWIPSYGPEMRGGTANCTVVVSDDPIGAPMVRNPTVVVVFNQPSMLKYRDVVKPGGVLVVNSSLVEATTDRDDITTLFIPATDTANALGEARMTNMVLCGALLGTRPIVTLDTLIETITAELPAHRQYLLDLNIEAISKGVELAQAQLVPA